MMYTNAILFLLGVLGVVLHGLVELNKINKATGGKANFKEYFKIEWITMIIGIIVVFIAIMVKHEIKQLEQVGNWLGVAFVAIGYMGQSLLIFVMGKAQNKIGKNEGN